MTGFAANEFGDIPYMDDKADTPKEKRKAYVVSLTSIYSPSKILGVCGTKDKAITLVNNEISTWPPHHEWKQHGADLVWFATGIGYDLRISEWDFIE